MSVKFNFHETNIVIRSLLQGPNVFCQVKNKVEHGTRVNREARQAYLAGPHGVEFGAKFTRGYSDVSLDSLGINQAWHQLTRAENQKYTQFQTKISRHCVVSIFVELDLSLCDLMKELPSTEMLRMLQNSKTIEVNGSNRTGFLIVSDVEFEAKEIIPQGKFGSNVQREFLHNTCLVYQTSKNSEIFVSKGFGNRSFRRLVTQPGQHHYLSFYGMKCHCGRTKCIDPLQYKEVIGYCGKMSENDLKKSDNFYERLAYHANNPFGARLGLFKGVKTHFNEIQKDAGKVAEPTQMFTIEKPRGNVRSSPPAYKPSAPIVPLDKEQPAKKVSDLDFIINLK